MPDYRMPDGTIPVLLSSDTESGLRSEAAAVLGYLEAHPDVAPNRVADMIFRTRMPRRHRALALVTDRAELLGALRAVAAGTAHPAVCAGDGPATARRIGFVFPGQGSQRPGMGALYHADSPEYRATVEECGAIHHDRFGDDKPLRYLLGHDGEFDDTVAEVQPALMFHMLGLAAMWRAAGVTPDATVGHSQGELAAGAVSGLMTVRDSVLAVTHRARLVGRIAPGGYSMAVLGMDRDACEALLARHSGWAELSVVNSPNILAISGDRDTIVDMVALAHARGRFAKEIQVAYPAHTSLVSEYRADLEAVLDDEMSTSHFASGDCPSYGATLGAPLTPDLTHRQYWYWNLRNRVRFDRAVIAAANDGVDTLIEIAEHPVLQLAIQENLGLVPGTRDFRVVGTSLRTAQSLREFSRNLALVAVHDANYHWDALRRDDHVTLPLRDFPHTRMEAKKLWARPSVREAAVPPAPETVKPSRLVERWVRLDRRTLTAPRRLAVVDHTGRCAESANALVDAAVRHGASGVVTGGSASGAAEPRVTDPEECDTVVILLPELPDTDVAGAVPALADFFAARPWLPALDRLRPDAGAACWLVTVRGESVLADDPVPNPVHAGVAAGFRAVGIERRGIALRHLDLPSGAVDAKQASRIVAALHTAGESELALRAGKVYGKRLAPDTALAPSAADTDLTHVLIVGGTGKLGMRFCAHYVAAGARRVTLLSRSGESDAISEELRPLREHAEIVAARCDVSDPAEVARFAAESAGHPVSLLVHAAVDYVDAELDGITPDLVARALGAKVAGLELMHAALAATATPRVLLCSSTAATLGGRGQILYAVTNRMLDVAARRLRAGGVDAISLQWGLWTVAGPLDAAGFARAASTGVLPMDPGDALETGLAGVWGDALVMAADWPFLYELTEVFGQARLLADLGIESRTPRQGAVPGVTEATAGNASVPAGSGSRGSRSGAGSAGLAQPCSGATVASSQSLAARLRAELRDVMGAESDETIDGSAPLVALGLDSLQALDFRKRVKAELNRDLPVAAILGGASLDDVLLLMADNTN